MTVSGMSATPLLLLDADEWAKQAYFEDTDDPDVAIYRGIEFGATLEGGGSVICKDGDRLHFGDADDEGLRPILAVIRAPLN